MVKRKRKKIVCIASVLVVFLAVAAAVFLKIPKDGTVEGTEDDSPGIVVMEYRWEEASGVENSVTIRHVVESGRYYLYNNRRMECRIHDIENDGTVLSLYSPSQPAGNSFHSFFDGHEDETILYTGTLEQAAQAAVWLEEEGAERLYSVATGKYMDIYYNYKGRQYRMLIYDMGDGDADVCFAPLEQNFKIPGKGSIIAQFDPY